MRVALIGPVPPRLGGATPGGVATHQVHLAAGLSAAQQLNRAGHTVTTLGRDGGDGSDADVVVVAVPSAAIDDALGKVTGVDVPV